MATRLAVCRNHRAGRLEDVFLVCNRLGDTRSDRNPELAAVFQQKDRHNRTFWTNGDILCRTANIFIPNLRNDTLCLGR